MTKAPRKTAERKTQPEMPGKRIVIFADGTGNSFSGNESNIWRLAQALDKTGQSGPSLQLMRYVPGVGTSGNALIRAVDGATGFGVPANVRKLYRFLCWNCDPQDQIFLFGFSRGAFTVRTLAAMIAAQGLMPSTRPDGTRVSAAEMRRNAMAAWLAYRKKTAPFVPDGASVWDPRQWQMNPLTALARGARDLLTDRLRDLRGQDRHARVVANLPAERKPLAVKVHFMGLFDTVEAYGMPLEVLTDIWNRLIWPIKFRNQRPAPIIGHLCHALALDDERHSFHPIRVDISPRTDDGLPVPKTRELWFAGMHSDVGGGYPDDEVSFEPLLWIAAEAAAKGLVFDDRMLDSYRRRLYPQALIHDSRAGLAMFYAYAPRQVTDDPRYGGAAVIDHSVVAKMDYGASGYSPQVLPATVRVRPRDSDDTADWAALPAFAKVRQERAVAAWAALVKRRKTMGLISAAIVTVLALLPVLEVILGAPPPASDLAAWLGWIVGGLVPSWALTWIDAMVLRWPISLPLLGLILWIWSYNQGLAHRIRDAARKLWAAPQSLCPTEVDTGFGEGQAKTRRPEPD